MISDPYCEGCLYSQIALIFFLQKESTYDIQLNAPFCSYESDSLKAIAILIYTHAKVQIR